MLNISHFKGRSNFKYLHTKYNYIIFENIYSNSIHLKVIFEKTLALEKLLLYMSLCQSVGECYRYRG